MNADVMAVQDPSLKEDLLDGRQAEVVRLLRATGSALDDDEIAARLGMNRHYVNQVCRGLAAQNVIRRLPGPGGKLITERSSRATTPGILAAPHGATRTWPFMNA